MEASGFPGLPPGMVYTGPAGVVSHLVAIILRFAFFHLTVLLLDGSSLLLGAVHSCIVWM